MNISDLKKVLDDIEEKYGDIEVTTYDEGGYTVDSECVRVFENDQKFFVFIGEDCVVRRGVYVYEKYIPSKIKE